ncbi:MAG: GNAT family N-acetyltransferase [Enterococcus sp.]
MVIREIQLADQPAIRQLIKEAFSATKRGYGNEAELVEKIRQSDGYLKTLELVVIKDGELVGHGLLSEVKIINEGFSATGLVLAPLTIKVAFQRQGLGKALMWELEKRAQVLTYPFISILGHADYYPKFGYQPASKFQVQAPFEVADESFMLKPLFEDALAEIYGTVKYSDAFE